MTLIGGGPRLGGGLMRQVPNGALLANLAGVPMPPASPSQMGQSLGPVLLGAVGGMATPRPSPVNASAAAGGVPAKPDTGDALDRLGVGGNEVAGVDPYQITMPQAAPPSKPKVNMLGVLADMLAGAAGREGPYATMMAEQRRLDALNSREDAQWQREREAKRADAMMPRVEEVGGAVGMLDPSRQSFEPFYTTPQPFERYAVAQGFRPGTPEYARAVEDYRLGSWSDPAMENRLELEGTRTEGRSALESLRSGYRMRELTERLGVQRRGQDIGSADRRRGQDITARGQRITSQDRAADRRQRSEIAGQTDRRIRDSAGFRGTPRRGSAANSARMVNPTTGQAIILKGGKWVDEKTGKPVS